MEDREKRTMPRLLSVNVGLRIQGMPNTQAATRIRAPSTPISNLLRRVNRRSGDGIVCNGLATSSTEMSSPGERVSIRLDPSLFADCVSGSSTGMASDPMF
jgi:hypothetical protein